MTASTANPLSFWSLLDRQGARRAEDESFILAERWLVPSDVRLDGDTLRYGKKFDRTAPPPSAKLLAEFVALEKASPRDIERFAKRWGMLGLCQHNTGPRSLLVVGHLIYGPLVRLHLERVASVDQIRRASRGAGSSTEKPQVINLPNPYLDKPCHPQLAEALESWRLCAEIFRGLLMHAEALRKRHRLKRRVTSGSFTVGDPKTEVREFLYRCNWLVRDFGCLRPTLVVENGKFDIKLGGRFWVAGLPAALTTQLLFTLAGGLELATCSNPGCGKMFVPKRRPRAGENRYCSTCGIRAAWRAAQRRRREAARRTYKQ